MLKNIIKGFLFRYNRKPLLTEMGKSKFRRGTWRLAEVYDLEEQLSRCVRYRFVDKDPIIAAWQVVNSRTSNPTLHFHDEIKEVRRVVGLMEDLINR